MNRCTIRVLARDEAVAHGERLRTIFRDAVLETAPRHYAPEQVATWAASADQHDRWVPWLRDGSTWVAAPVEAPDHVIGVAMVHPAGYVHLLYVDPAFHRRGVASALLAALEPSAIAAGVDALTADASLISHPVFERSGYAVVAWEEVEVRGHVFRRAKMRKALR
jgi:putative acetyltransferase